MSQRSPPAKNQTRRILSHPFSLDVKVTHEVQAVAKSSIMKGGPTIYFLRRLACVGSLVFYIPTPGRVNMDLLEGLRISFEVYFMLALWCNFVLGDNRRTAHFIFFLLLGCVFTWCCAMISTFFAPNTSFTWYAPIHYYLQASICWAPFWIPSGKDWFQRIH